jgi:hypothetical protein
MFQTTNQMEIQAEDVEVLGLWCFGFGIMVFGLHFAEDSLKMLDCKMTVQWGSRECAMQFEGPLPATVIPPVWHR